MRASGECFFLHAKVIKKRPAQPIVDSSSDTDDLLPHVSLTKKRCTEGPSDVDFHAIKDDISAIRKDMEFFYQIDKRMKIPSSAL